MTLDSHDIVAIVISAFATLITSVSIIVGSPDTTTITTGTLVLFGTIAGYVFGKGIAEEQIRTLNTKFNHVGSEEG